MSEQNNKSAEELAAAVKADFEKSISAVREIAEKAVAEAAKGIPMAESAKELADEALKKMAETQGSLAEIEQRMARQKGGEAARLTLGNEFINSDAFKNGDKNSSTFRASLETKATITTVTTDTDGAVGDAIAPTRLGLIVAQRQPLRVRDLIAQGNMDGNTLEYPKETGFNNNAALVAEGAAKPESDIKLDLVTETAKTIAHTMKASTIALSDVSQLRSMIDTHLAWGVGYVEEQQILFGDGTGLNMRGIVPQATAYAAPSGVTGESNIDQIRYAMLQASLALYPATGIVVNEIDWALIETAKESGTGRYIIGNPQGRVGATLWGLPVVTTQSMPEDKFLVGAFQMGAQIFDRWTTRIEVGYVDDDFAKNLVTIRGEKRAALAVYRPEAFVYGDLGRIA